MKLYYSPGACSLSDHIALVESGLEHELAKVDLKAKTVEGEGDYRAINPKGSVPALRLDDGSVLTENAAILQYIGDRAENLLPEAHSMERYRLQEWLSYIGSELHKGFGPFFRGGDTEAAKKVLAIRFAHLDASLADRDYLMGESFSVADAYAFTVLRWTKRFDISLDAYPALSAYVARVGSRPKVMEAMAAEGLTP